MQVPSPKFTEKGATESKKYMAAMRFNWTWAALIGTTFVFGTLAHLAGAQAVMAGLVTILIAEIICLGFVQVLYLGGQTAVDTFVRVAIVIVTGRNGSVLDDDDDPVPAPPTSEGE